jgi:dTMP kinase
VALFLYGNVLLIRLILPSLLRYARKQAEDTERRLAEAERARVELEEQQERQLADAARVAAEEEQRRGEAEVARVVEEARVRAEAAAEAEAAEEEQQRKEEEEKVRR